MKRSHRHLKWTVGLAVVLAVAQLATYETVSDALMVDVVVHLSPANCRAVCCSYYLQRDMDFDQSQRRRLDRLLTTKHQSVYRNLDELPESELILDAQYEFQGIVGVCLLTWERVASGPFWFQAKFSVWHAPSERPAVPPGYRPAVDETYVWGLYRWVRVKSIPSWWRTKVVAQYAH
jgi:hypothetical protein